MAVKRVKREREDTAVDAIHRAEQRLPPEQRLALQQMRLLQRARMGSSGGAASDVEVLRLRLFSLWRSLAKMMMMAPCI